MAGEVFKETLRQRWREAAFWALGMAVFAVYAAFLTPDSEGLQGYMTLLQAMPPALLKGIGLTDMSVIATPEGFLGFAFFTYAVVVLSVFGVATGLNVTANDEELGVMNLVLALPLPRWRVVAERAAAFVLFAVVVTFGAWVGLAVGKAINPAIAGIDTGKMLQACVATVPTVLIVMGMTALLGVLVRRRNIAAALAGGFVGVSYVLNALGGVAGPGIGSAMKQLSLYNYFDATSAALNGIDVVPFAVMSFVAAGLFLATARVFDRRDVSV